MKHDISEDDRAKIVELKKQGHGRNWIAHLLDINASAVKSVLEGQRKNYSDQLSTRQRQSLLNSAFGPPCNGR